MKKILAYIVAFVLSLSNGTTYTNVDEKEYTSDYFTITGEEAPDYREYYSGSGNNVSTAGCRISTFTANAMKLSWGSGYWFVNGKTVEESSINSENSNVVLMQDSAQANPYYVLKGIFGDNETIICPYSATLESSTVTNDCTSMRLLVTTDNGSHYRLTITGMKCWYCDFNRTGEIYGHTVEEFGQGKTTFRAGYVLGKATSDTQIAIVPVGTDDTDIVIGTSTPAEFYRQTYTSFDK